MQMKPLGRLTPDPEFPDWLTSPAVAVAYLDGVELPFILEGLADDDNLAEVQAAVQGFLDLNCNDRRKATRYVYRHYRELVEPLAEQGVSLPIEAEEDVWSNVHPTEVRVCRRHRRDRKVYVQIVADCDWEQEHGLQIVLREGVALSRVSDQDGHLTTADAYDWPEERDCILPVSSD